MIDHDAQPGPLTRCQICGSDDLHEVIDLGFQPPCDALLTAEQLHEPELTFPLRLMQCGQCTLAQLDYVVPGELIYPADYPYRAGISWPVVEAHKQMAAEIVHRFGQGFCVDIGCNDGTLLAQLKALGCRVWGVEPTDQAKVAEEQGIEVSQEFFRESSTAYIRGQVNVVTMTNVFAHMADLGEVMRGVRAMLAREGVLIVENHYLLDIFEKTQFDSIYHEHIRSYSLQSLMTLFEQYDMEVFDVERKPRYGGNIRVYVGNRGVRPVQASVGELLQHEISECWFTPGGRARFRDRVRRLRDHFNLFHLPTDDICGCSAPGRASTLLNYYGIDSSDMPYIAQLSGSEKIGRYIPGCHIPVVDDEILVRDQPEHIVLLAWHYADEIAARLRREGVKGRLWAPLPTLHEVHA